MNAEGLSIHIPSERATFYFDSIKQKNEFIKNHVRYGADWQPFLINRGWKRQNRYTNNYDYYRE